MNDLRIRTMRPDEISIAVNWAAAEGWNPGLADDTRFAAIEEGFLIGELDGAPAATVCVNYGTTFAFLGFYIVRELGTNYARGCNACNYCSAGQSTSPSSCANH